MKLSVVLDQVDNGTMLLPEFQRGYVWNRDQVRGLMKSVYREFPVGALLVWETDVSADRTRGGGVFAASGGQKRLLLDGQQRVTSLYGVIRGEAPGFFDGDPEAFTGLHFNVETEEFLFYAPTRMRNDPRWIDVTSLFRKGMASVIPSLTRLGLDDDVFSCYVERLTQLTNISSRDFHIEVITGADKTIDVVVDIFNRVNSGGTKLSKGDLALARICSEWDQARPTMRRFVDDWSRRGFSFSLDWVLRNTTAVATGRAPFSALADVSADDFEVALAGAHRHVDHLLHTLLERFGLDHDRVLLGKSAFPVLTRVLDRSEDGRFSGPAEANRAMAWIVHAALRGRYTGAIETNLNKDLQIADAEGVDGLLASLTRLHKGSLAIRAEDFEGVGRGARSYPLLYLLTRAVAGRDLLTGQVFDRTVASLHVQEIFPKAALVAHGYPRNEINAIANFAFVTHGSGARLGDRLPTEALADCSPDGLRAQWIPADRELWTVERYPEFLAARRALLADEADRFLAALAEGSAPWPSPPLYGMDAPTETIDRGARAAQIKALLDEFAALGFADPMVDCDVPDLVTGQLLAHAEAFWPDGLQAGQDEAVVLELDPDEADLDRLAENGCRVFTSVDTLRNFALRRQAVIRGDEPDEGTRHPAPAVREEAVPDDERGPVDADGAPVEAEFERAVLAQIDTCVADLRYNPSYLRLLVSQHGTLGTARRLLAQPAVSDGFVKLHENRRLDLTIEALVVDPRFAALFSEQEREIARTRLAEFGWSAAA
ncbi:GmrSD restriction endonuclease domain-containing protein [Actinomycetospora sp. CA-084318]|uniref:GmrSD restriction endonuclease domain-containing protein n=1 Tax=Actinomycetospora sp. CA-084318 TaxID=3239892 RepID=UPI003D99F46E